MNRFFPTPTLRRLAVLCFTAFLVCGLTATAKQTALLQGRLLDEKTGQPVEAKYVITVPGGRNLKGKSSSDGSFKQILNAGESYTITFNDYNIVKTVADFSMPAGEKYYEEKKDFRVRVFQSGEQLLSIVGFDKDKPSLTSAAVAELTKIAELMKENRSLEVNITVAADEQAKKAASQSKTKAKKGKKGKAAEAEAAPVADASSAASAAVQARADMVRSRMEQIDPSIVKRITVVNSPSPSASATLVVNIGQLKNKFE